MTLLQSVSILLHDGEQGKKSPLAELNPFTTNINPTNNRLNLSFCQDGNPLKMSVPLF